MGPVLLHKEATYKVYKTFLEHVSTEVDNDIDEIEVRISEQMEFGSDDEKALTKAIEHVFPLSERYFCTKHLKDNIKHYCQNKVGMPKTDRQNVMNKLFDQDGLVDSNTTVDFDVRADEIDSTTKRKVPYVCTLFRIKLETKTSEITCFNLTEEEKMISCGQITMPSRSTTS